MGTISVIGGAGFIGTRLCAGLAAAGARFEIIDLKASRSFQEASKIADIRDADALRAAMTGEVIVHLAAVHRDDVRDKALYSSTNVEGTRNVCKVADEIGARKLIFTSSVAVYGFAPQGTDETGAINPFHDYGRTKFEAEEVLRAWRDRRTEAELIIVRPTVVFGAGNRGNVYNLLRQIASGRFVMIGHGNNRKSMAYVGNVAAFLQHAIESKCHYGVFNYVDAPDFSMKTLVREVKQTLSGSAGSRFYIPFPLGLAIGHAADAVAKLSGRSLPISAIRVRKFCATTSFGSSKAALNGFEAPFTLKEGLRRTLDAEFVNPDPNRDVFYTE
ncbi:N-acetyl-alpha-D-glucosaminyl-diphospho-ditrans,octacis-undecaprenol 4-epimerase [uncultured Defluviicoccus sp.]|uniref:N-acetyl-alpha-D-glucosaminyl-diphospho-ditrans,octacis-undecaprenol 4-epimerase n=1 Tax=metagenome TaxID=256318 RepID=A0A380TAZ1_9ZZZZ|nr:N-acetyl-alpha-D-glucosaminyl-diphospho-ditrans,octacis-undecaprenol 4-epimerase [uncultured Defluviicoccus sp.]SUS07164.1 N-acetyl-alpha-D-glucosaminyl-diphospho-ditrans,octacis-undecaprenol 4-epimerase [uncultured Defluviicoccus sp.]